MLLPLFLLHEETISIGIANVEESLGGTALKTYMYPSGFVGSGYSEYVCNGCKVENRIA